MATVGGRRWEPLNARTMTRKELEGGLRAWGIAPTEAARIARDLRWAAVQDIVWEDRLSELFGEDDGPTCGDAL